MRPDEVEAAIRGDEGERLELKASLNSVDDRTDVREAACAFANDFAHSGRPGLVIIGVKRNLDPSGAPVTDELIRQLADVRDDGQISPPILISAYRSRYRGSEIAVLEVAVSAVPPVRFKGRTCIRVGSRRAYASYEEETRLAERAPSRSQSFDMRACPNTTIRDISSDLIVRDFLPRVVSHYPQPDDRRPIEEKLQALRLFDIRSGGSTNAGILLFGHNTQASIPGAAVEFARFPSGDRSMTPVVTRLFTGNILSQLTELELFLKGPTEPATNGAVEPGEDFAALYPPAALRELVVNAVMHRAYDGTNSPTRLLRFADRVEIENPGGLWGQVNEANFEHMTDYRNPVIAGALRAYGWVERLGSGIPRVRAELARNGNPPPQFEVDSPSLFRVVVPPKPG
jgi:ATP-dependent DNA helicase RecG